MTREEKIVACAELMGWEGWRSKHGYWNVTSPDGNESVCCDGWQSFDPHSGEKLREPTFSDALSECDYNPYSDDAQAMALVKKLYLQCTSADWRTEKWQVMYGQSNIYSVSADLNTAIVDCAAQIAERGKG